MSLSEQYIADVSGCITETFATARPVLLEAYGNLEEYHFDTKGEGALPSRHPVTEYDIQIENDLAAALYKLDPNLGLGEKKPAKTIAEKPM